MSGTSTGGVEEGSRRSMTPAMMERERGAGCVLGSYAGRDGVAVRG